MRDLFVKIANLVRRARVDRPGVKPQLTHLGGAVVADVEHFEPQGVHFLAPKDAQGLLLSPNAEPSIAVVIGLSGQVPPAPALQAGEGGLHLLGVFKVFLSADGKLALGAASPSDWVALASKTDAGFDTRGSDITTLINATAAVASAVDSVVPGTSTTFNLATASIPATVPSVASTAVKCQ